MNTTCATSRTRSRRVTGGGCAEEIEALVKNANTCDDWDSILVADPFCPQLIKNCEVAGLVRIGRLERVALEHHELKVQAGITNSRIIACDLGDNVAIHNVHTSPTTSSATT